MHWFTSSRRLMGYLVAAPRSAWSGAGSYAVASAGTNAIHACADKRTGGASPREVVHPTRACRVVVDDRLSGASATKLFVLDDIDGNVVRSNEQAVTVSQQSTRHNSPPVPEEGHSRSRRMSLSS